MLYSCQDILTIAQKPVALQRRLGLLGQCLRDVPFRLFRRRLFHLKALFRRKSRFMHTVKAAEPEAIRQPAQRRRRIAPDSKALRASIQKSGIRVFPEGRR